MTKEIKDIKVGIYLGVDWRWHFFLRIKRGKEVKERKSIEMPVGYIKGGSERGWVIESYCEECGVRYDKQRGNRRFCDACRGIVRERKRKEYKAKMSTPENRYEQYRKGSVARGIEFQISYEEFLKYWQKPCVYCGSEIITIGLDRKDNNKGYEIGNLEPCCSVCNFMKHKLNHEVFMRQVERIYRFRQTDIIRLLKMTDEVMRQSLVM